MHVSMLGILVWERIKPDVAQVLFYFFPLMQNRCQTEISHLLFQCCSLLLLAVTAAVTRCTPEKCTFDRWNVSFFGTFTWPNLSPRWWPWQHWASQGPCAWWQPESMSRKGGVHAVRNSFLVSKTRRFRQDFSDRLWFRFLGRCGNGLLMSSLQSLDFKLWDVEQQIDFLFGSHFWAEGSTFQRFKSQEWWAVLKDVR